MREKNKSHTIYKRTTKGLYKDKEQLRFSKAYKTRGRRK